MSQLIPMFPLELVLYPEEDLSLHIFEPKYKELIQDVKDQGMPFGIPVYQQGKKLTYGSTAALSSIENEYSDGRLDIITKGLRAFKIKTYVKIADSKLYGAAEVEYLELTRTPEVSINLQIIDLIQELYNQMDIDKEIPDADTELFTFKIAHQVGLSINQELQVLTIESESDRAGFIHDHLLNLIPVVREMEALRKKVQMNGHFKNIIPPDIS